MRSAARVRAATGPVTLRAAPHAKSAPTASSRGTSSNSRRSNTARAEPAVPPSAATATAHGARARRTTAVPLLDHTGSARSLSRMSSVFTTAAAALVAKRADASFASRIRPRASTTSIRTPSERRRIASLR